MMETFGSDNMYDKILNALNNKQTQLIKLQKKLADTFYVGFNDNISITINGDIEIVDITIYPSFSSLDDLDIKRCICYAFNDAVNKARLDRREKIDDLFKKRGNKKWN